MPEKAPQSGRQKGRQNARGSGRTAGRGDSAKAVEQGYSLQEIRDVLAQSGVQISLARMRNLLNGPDEKDSDAGECKVQKRRQP